jgi:hypothetical protein
MRLLSPPLNNNRAAPRSAAQNKWSTNKKKPLTREGQGLSAVLLKQRVVVG